MEVCLSDKELRLLRLVGWCKNLSEDCISLFGETIFTPAAMQRLIKLELLRPPHSTYGIRLHTAGYRCLQEHGYPMAQDKHTQRVGRRFENSEVIVTMSAAGISPFCPSIADLRRQTGYLPASVLRAKEGQHSLGSTQITGFLHAGETLFGVYYPTKENQSLSPQRERDCIQAVALAADCKRQAILFMGTDYHEIYIPLLTSPPEDTSSIRRRKKANFAQFYESLHLPCYFVQCAPLGAVQLRLLIEPAYRQRLAKLLAPACDDICLSACDFILPEKKLPCVLMLDMNLRRLDAATKQALKNGAKQLGVVAFPQQIQFLRRYYQDAFFYYFRIDKSILEAFQEV